MKSIVLDELDCKVLRLAEQICKMHASVAGGRTCQDWSGDTAILGSLTDDEKNFLNYRFEQWNSRGEEYEPDDFEYDEMVISFIVAHAVGLIAAKYDGRAPRED